VQNKKIESFTDLIVWQEAHRLVIETYVITKKFPKEELYSLVDQLKRAVVSITSNIAEGFSRKSYKEKSHFYYLSLGSLTEIQNQLLVAKDVRYISKEEFTKLAERSMSVKRLLRAFITKTDSFCT
jgi:four helix bundle protein